MMKKTFFYAVSAFLMLSACTQELVSDIQEQPTLKEGGATIAATINDESATRVAVDQAGVEGKTTLKWEKGDRILVASGQRGYTFMGNFIATQADGHFALFQEETGSTGTFSATKVNEAYFPAAAWNYSESDPAYTFPAEQIYLEGTFDRNAMPMVASSSDGNFAFSIEAAVLRLNVSNAVENGKLNKITLASKTHSLSGRAVLSYTDFLKPSGSKSVSLLCNDVKINTVPKPFYIVVPAGTYEAGDLSLTFTARTVTDEKTSIKAFTLEVGKVYDMNMNITLPAAAPTMYGFFEGGTKTGINSSGMISWKPSESINVFFGTTRVDYCSTNEQDTDYAVFETGTIINHKESSSDNRWGLYPHDSSAVCDGESVTTTIPSAQRGVPDTFDNNLFTMIAHTQDDQLCFKPVCGGIVFTLSRNDIKRIRFRGNNYESLCGQVRLSYDGDRNPVAEVVKGESEIILTPSDGNTFAQGTSYYLVMLPCVLSQGFTMTFLGENEIGTLEYTIGPLEIKRSSVVRMKNIDSRAVFAAPGANCFIVSEYGPVSFDARYKGNSDEPVGDIASVEVLWESFGNDVQPAVGDIVKDVTVQDGIVSFTASGKDGNAVIAVKDANGTILWSWHIWVCKDFDPAATAHEYYNNAGTVMDRNLGATSATKGDVKALGLLYQWGRKDPFLSGQSISSSTKAKSTITWPSPVKSDANNGTIDYVVKHPTTFVTYRSSNYDWYCTGSSSTDNTRWNSSKGMYDPCPKGWKVPDGGSNGLWAKAFGTSSPWTTSSNWDSTNKGMDFGSTDKKLGSGEIWYPASGYLYYTDGTLYYVGDLGIYWSCTPSGYYAYTLGFDHYGNVRPSLNYFRARGQSVRCLQE